MHTTYHLIANYLIFLKKVNSILCTIDTSKRKDWNSNFLSMLTVKYKQIEK